MQYWILIFSARQRPTRDTLETEMATFSRDLISMQQTYLKHKMGTDKKEEGLKKAQEQADELRVNFNIAQTKIESDIETRKSEIADRRAAETDTRVCWSYR